MLLFWRVRYLDTRDRQFKDRDLWLETNDLPAAAKTAVELCYEMGGSCGNPRMLQFRSLFQERSHSKDEMEGLVGRSGRMGSIFLHDYFEDENGDELTRERMGHVLTGDPNAVLLPSSMKQHDIDFMFAPKPTVDLRQITVPQKDLDVLAYFSRDLRELVSSSFFAEGPGTLSAIPGREPSVDTAASADEIGAFVMIFRRLYMTGEPGNFLKAADAFARALTFYPVARWVQGVAGEYRQALDGVPDLVPFSQGSGPTFTRKLLIDAFIYTQYAHQGEERRERQYADCLAQVNGKRPVLFWLFLRSAWECALHIRNAGAQISSFTEQYYKCQGITPRAIGPASEYAGLGQLEKKNDRSARILREKTEELAMTLWQNAGRPAGGSGQFLLQAREQLREAMDEGGDPGEEGAD